MDVHPRIYNYYALTLAVLNPHYSIDEAIDYFSPDRDKPSRRVRQLMKAEIMIRMRDAGMTTTEVGQVFGITKSAVSHLIHRAMAKK